MIETDENVTNIIRDTDDSIFDLASSDHSDKDSLTDDPSLNRQIIKGRSNVKLEELNKIEQNLKKQLQNLKN